MMRKTGIRLLCAGLLAACLAGCSLQEEPGEFLTRTEKEKVEIWYYWETEGHQNALNHVVGEYNASQDRYQVETQYVPFADFKKQLSIRASADDLPDMVIIDSPDHAYYADMGIFADLTGKYDVSGYYEGAVASCTLENRLYGVPFGCNCLALYYNEDLLREAGVKVPETWEELKTAAAALTSDGVTGFAVSSVQNEEGTFGFMPFLWSAGASCESMGSPEAVKALTLFQELTSNGSMSKECINWIQADVMEQFISGKIAMMVNGSWQIPTMEAKAPGLNWSVAPIPHDRESVTVIGGENYAVIHGGNEKGALQFLQYATSKENEIYLMKSFGYIAAQTDIANIQYSEGDNPAYQVFVDQLKHAGARGPHRDWPDISDAVSLAFNQVIRGTMQPQEAAFQAQETIDEILK